MAQRREKASPQEAPVPAKDTAALSAPRFALGWAALVNAVATLSLAYPALAGRFLVNPHSDQYIAGYAFRDAAFGSRLVRITDGLLQPDSPNISYRTPSGTHTNAWSADARYFYAVNSDGWPVPFSFDRTTQGGSFLSGQFA